MAKSKKVTIHELNGDMYSRFNIIKNQDIGKTHFLQNKLKRRLMRNKSRSMHHLNIESNLQSYQVGDDQVIQ